MTPQARRRRAHAKVAGGSGGELRRARLAAGLTQAQVAKRLMLTQAYVSMLEQGRRTVPDTLLEQVAKVYRLGPTALPFSGKTEPMDSQQVFEALSALGYPGFAYARYRRKLNPAELLLRALRHPDLEVRVTEGLPWVVFRFPDLDWDWLVREAKVANVQNRLGFVVTLARMLAEERSETAKAHALRERERELEASRLAGEDTFCRSSVTDVLRRWMRENRPAHAAQWNLLTTISTRDLQHVDDDF